MAKKYKYKSLSDLIKAIKNFNCDIPYTWDLDVLKRPVKLGQKIIPNSIALHPMEGCDAAENGSPDNLTFRRYKRFAQGGAGLIWVEATAVVPEGRANQRQLYICKENVKVFQELQKKIKEVAVANFGSSHTPYTVLQLTHSGRYSRPHGKPAPIIAVENPYLHKDKLEYKIIKDEELEQLEDYYVHAAELARDAGFDAVDIKCCHGYLISELLSAHTRKGRYGGSFENRTRFLLNIIDKIKARLGNAIDVTVRINAYDGIPYPYGWGVDKREVSMPDLAEPIALIKRLREKGVILINVSAGNPYYKPHIGRPFDTGAYSPPEEPLKGVLRLLIITKTLQKHEPEAVIVATGLSLLRDFAPPIAAGCIEKGWFKIAGFGRQAFAYPEFPKDIFFNNGMKRDKCCITCSKCTEIMRMGGSAGCVIRDQEVYLNIYKQLKNNQPK